MAGVDVYFSLGSNMGDRKKNISRAISMMEQRLSIRVSAVSDILETTPWGFDSKENFYNAVMRFEIPQVGQDTDLFSHALLRICKEIEHELGREDQPLYDESGQRLYFSRPIDIDILFYGRANIKSKSLIIPHLGISERDFVMIPLKQVAKCNLIESFPLIFN